MSKFYKISEEKMIAIADRVRAMAGTTNKMTVDDVVYWLGRVLYIPQGWANTTAHLENIEAGSNASGMIATIQRGFASSELLMEEMTVTTTASGTLEE